MSWLGRCVLVLAFAVWGEQASGAESVPEAEEFVTDLGRTAIETLTGDQLADDEREVRFRELLTANFDVPRIGNRVLAIYARQATPEELNSFYNVFEDLLVATYIGRFEEYSGEGFSVVRSFPDGNDGAVVLSEISGRNGERIRVDWQLRRRDGHYVVVDVAVEAISIAATLREEYGSILRQNGGSVAALVEALRARLG
jgi:phospholipid transport system substrate-binding protein